LKWALSFVVETVLRVMVLWGAAGFPLNGVFGIIIKSSSMDRHLWAVQCGYVSGTRAADCRYRVAGLVVLKGDLDFEVTELFLFVCLRGRVVPHPLMGNYWGI